MQLTDAQSNLLGSVLGFGGSMLGGLISGATSSRAARKAFNYNKQLISMQQEWQERMSNTAHQREVADLRAAGLNPILSATGGSGASFGSASAPGMSVQPADFGDLGVSSALAIRQQRNQNKLTESQNELTTQQSKTERWKALNEQQNYDEVVPLQMEQIKANIMNQTAVSAAQARNFDAQSNAVLMNALTNRIQANTSAGDLAYKQRSKYYEGQGSSILGKGYKDLSNIINDFGDPNSTSAKKLLKSVKNLDHILSVPFGK